LAFSLPFGLWFVSAFRLVAASAVLCVWLAFVCARPVILDGASIELRATDTIRLYEPPPSSVFPDPHLHSPPFPFSYDCCGRRTWFSPRTRCKLPRALTLSRGDRFSREGELGLAWRITGPVVLLLQPTLNWEVGLAVIFMVA
jgi:hypothetical protein